ncbi:hypothetical protein ACFQV2_12490 [Actinokineospora soli]|uniref:Tetratricopeptide repeat protein n=1 Tax=Actinokineospora soli TaxID=1048753 RepID=A0ABW2TN43_9PSEU
MSGGDHHIAVMADCERALGRPERALDLAKEAGPDLPPDVAVELRIVVAGARRDMGQLEAAVVGLQGPDLDPKRRDPWSARLFYAHADNLAAAGNEEDAIRWFLAAAQADDDGETDAAERAFELGADESEVAALRPETIVELVEDPRAKQAPRAPQPTPPAETDADEDESDDESDESDEDEDASADSPRARTARTARTRRRARTPRTARTRTRPTRTKTRTTKTTKTTRRASTRLPSRTASPRQARRRPPRTADR